MTVVEVVVWLLATDRRPGERVHICGCANTTGESDEGCNVDIGGNYDKQDV